MVDESAAWDEQPEASPGWAPDDRESAYALLQRGQALSQRRHYAQAAVVLARADRIEPGRGSILEPLGRAYYMSRQWDQAAEIFERLLEVDPSAHYAHYALGQSRKQQGRTADARLHLRLAVALSPSSRLYRDALGRLPAIPPVPRRVVWAADEAERSRSAPGSPGSAPVKTPPPGTPEDPAEQEAGADS